MGPLKDLLHRNAFEARLVRGASLEPARSSECLGVGSCSSGYGTSGLAPGCQRLCRGRLAIDGSTSLRGVDRSPAPVGSIVSLLSVGRMWIGVAFVETLLTDGERGGGNTKAPSWCAAARVVGVVLSPERDELLLQGLPGSGLRVDLRAEPSAGSRGNSRHCAELAFGSSGASFVAR